MRTVVLSAVLVVLVADGCGGASSRSTTPSESARTDGAPFAADYIEVADTICANHQSRREDLESQARDLGPIDSARKANRIAGLLRQESDNRLAETQELEGRLPPAGDDPEAAALVSLLRSQAMVIQDWARAYDDLDSSAIRRLQTRVGTLTARASRVARQNGFEVCGQH